jgi:PRTRC genetic system protein A
MNPYDVSLRAHLPTVMVPRYEALSPCPQGRMRLLMAQDGLYLEASTPWADLRLPLWRTQRILPYGPVEPQDGFSAAVPGLAPLLAAIASEAAKFAEHNLEWASWIVWEEGRGFRYQPLEFEATPARARYRVPSLPEGTWLVADIHSHGRGRAFFSPEDDLDDQAGLKISIVLGSYDPGRRGQPFLCVVRYCIYGFFLEPPGLGATPEESEEVQLDRIG